MDLNLIEYDRLKLSILPTVYPPAEDSFLLAKWAARLVRGAVLEVGCGCALASLACARENEAGKVLGVDVNPYAVKCSRENAIANKIKNAKFLESDLFSAVNGKKFDWLLFNPPYLPTGKKERMADENENAAYDGRKSGRKIVDAFLSQFEKYLAKNGSLLLVSSSISGTEKTVEGLERKGFRTRVLETAPFFFEKLSLICATKRKLDYSAALWEIRSLELFGMKLGLSRMQKILSALGEPQKQFRVIAVAGTNGKGSVATMVASVLQEAGFCVGLYTSPHVDDFRERFLVQGKMTGKRSFSGSCSSAAGHIPRSGIMMQRSCMISEDEFVREYAKVDVIAQKMADRPTFFEVTTALALNWFASKNVEFAVLEVGLGGRLDATNAADAEVVVVTGIGIEHAKELGGTLEKIANEKAGIIKQGSSVVVGKMEKEALDAIVAAAKEKNAKKILIYGEDFDAAEIACRSNYSEFDYRIGNVKFPFELSLFGRFQGQNAACAIAAVSLLPEKDKIGIGKLLSGLKKARIGARLETVSLSPLVVMDAAHNPQAMEKLAQSLPLFKYKRLVLVFGAMADKDIEGVLSAIGPKAGEIIVNQPKVARAANAEWVAKIAGKYCKKVYVIPDVKKSVAHAKKMARKGDMVLIAGSIYMIAEARGKDRLGISM